MSGVPELCAAGQVICRSGTFLHAVQKMQRALFEFHVRGVKVRSASALRVKNRLMRCRHAVLLLAISMHHALALQWLPASDGYCKRAPVQTNILFLENVLRHPEFLSGQATTSFIDRHPQLFNFNSRGSPQSSLVLSYLADLVRCRAGCVHCQGYDTAMCIYGAVCAYLAS